MEPRDPGCYRAARAMWGTVAGWEPGTTNEPLWGPLQAASWAALDLRNNNEDDDDCQEVTQGEPTSGPCHRGMLDTE